MHPQPKQDGLGNIFSGAEAVCSKPEKEFEQVKHLRKANSGGKHTTPLFGSASMSCAMKQNCAIPFDDGVTFKIETTSSIRENYIYSSYRVMLTAKFNKSVFTEALAATANYHGSAEQNTEIPSILHSIKNALNQKPCGINIASNSLMQKLLGMSALSSR